MTASTPIPIYSSGETFLVPAFRLELDSNTCEEQDPRYSPLPPEVTADVISIAFTDSVDRFDSCRLTVNNWDAALARYRHEPPAPPGTRPFLPGHKVKLAMGYRDRPDDIREMFQGEITGVAGTYEDGAPTLAVTLLDRLHTLRRRQHTQTWTDKKDSDIAREIGDARPSVRRPGIGIHIETPNSGDERPEEFVSMNGEYDIVFLLNRARRHGYDLVLERDASGSPQLRFGRPAREVTYRLEWGKSLISFMPKLDTTNVPAAVKFRGWNRRTDEAIDKEVTWQQVVDSADRERVQALSGAFHQRPTSHTRPVHTPDEAEWRARQTMDRALRNMVTASCETVGLPDLRAGRKVEITGLEQRVGAQAPGSPWSLFEGTYFITSSTHTMGAEGYRTRFEARREGPVSRGSP
jgi:phage protein D